ncbi:MAG: hypothetical protein H8D23_35645 [Candidatus Brocadiales bacterium]|nr:hypothetical protein [Candidatus Brocadiales bacterium]
MSVLYGGKVKLTGDDVQKIYGISKKSYDTFVWNLRHCSHYSFYMIFYQAKSDRKHLLQYDDEMNDMERKMKFYKDGYEKTYVKYLKLADRLRKYEDVDL